MLAPLSGSACEFDESFSDPASRTRVFEEADIRLSPLWQRYRDLPNAQAA